MPLPRITSRAPSASSFHKIPLAIEQLEAQGHPVIIDWVPPMDERTQRLFAALGVLVRFI